MSARPGLYGGQPAMVVPAAIVNYQTVPYGLPIITASLELGVQSVSCSARELLVFLVSGSGIRVRSRGGKAA